MRFAMGVFVGLIVAVVVFAFALDSIKKNIREEIVNSLSTIGTNLIDALPATSPEEDRVALAEVVGSQARKVWQSTLKGWETTEISLEEGFDEERWKAIFEDKFYWNRNGQNDAAYALEVARKCYMDGVTHGINAAVDAR